MRIRLSISIAISLTLAPLLYPYLQAATGDVRPVMMLKLIASETLIGMVFGLSGRLYLAAAEMAGTVIASLIGFGGLPGAPIDGEPIPPLSALITVTATALFFIAGLHLQVLEALVGTYHGIAPGSWFQSAHALTLLVDQLGVTLVLTGKLAAPFIIYAVVINLAVGLTNKLSPQIPVFFISLPFVLAGGLMLFLFSGDAMMLVYKSALESWLAGV